MLPESHCKQLVCSYFLVYQKYESFGDKFAEQPFAKSCFLISNLLLEKSEKKSHF